ncbi:hypothetical protein GCM10010214_33850 [Streptomyces abikoensis]|nr:hypothetical protein GCM10010214_33850 [Streptomyces abikoensis]
MLNLIRRLASRLGRPQRPRTPDTPCPQNTPHPQRRDYAVVVTPHGINFIPRQPSAADMAGEVAR